MPQPDMTPLLADHFISQALQPTNQNVQRTRRAAASCGYKGYQLVFDVVQLHQPGTRRVVLKVQSDCLQNIGTELFPRVAFGEDGMAQRTRAKATFLCVANLEDQLHDLRIPRERASCLDLDPRRVGRAVSARLKV